MIRRKGVLLIAICSLFVIKIYANSNKYNVELKDTIIPKNIILMIGDGMGLTQLSSGMYGQKKMEKMSIEKMPVIGFHKPYAATDLVTDSAAGATAFACGSKTKVGMVGMTPDSLPCKTILETMEEYGRSTGLVVTSTIVHATPASFIAHQPIRSMYESIANDIANSDVDLLIGGGKTYFVNRNDNQNLYEKLEEQGFTIGDFFDQPITEFHPSANKKMAFFTANYQPLTVEQGRSYLPHAAAMATRFLDKYDKQDKGFFLMIEGSQIDWAGHSNRGDLVIQEVLDFDRAIGRVLDFARRDGETLVIITADHETGGMAILPESKQGELKFGFTTKMHTAALVPVYAYGPQAELFRGIYENTAIYDKIMQATQLTKERPSN